ncbi:flagellar motor switch protein FliN/FliY [Sulfurivirga caldicuralii]|uniref:Flagellar motor switch protein FliN n=1 Tax=Sulfurivirga caldicuralii TaxID=364032 RepID=A0A1N6FLC8_9GAMM|nr:flagellar motor switch protein FliN [Sulfurivirga caldicuralii]SIN96093.1 flagellar motor switch protein FliN/FliY [Sulfurivirga caldicuralii]
MSEENNTPEDDDNADWGDALKEQAKAEQSEGNGQGEEGAADDWAAALTEQAEATDDAVSTEEAADIFNALRADSDGNKLDLDVLLDIPVTVSLEIGRTRATIRNLLAYSQGSVVELDRLAGEPLDVLVNGTLIAHGEVVVINDKFGVRLTDVISPQERIKKLK